MPNVDDILEQCVEEVLAGRSTVDHCLADYPQFADVLGPLLHTALDIDALDRLEASRAAFEVGKRAMMGAVARRERDRARSRAARLGPITRFLPFLGPTGGTGARLAKLAVVGALGTATVLVWLGAAGLLLRAWRTAVLPQTCVVAETSGIAQIQTTPGSPWQPLAAGEVLHSGLRIRTGNPAEVTVSFVDGSTSSLGADSELVIAQVASRLDGSGGLVVVQQVSGTTYNRVKSEPESVFQIETPSASVIVHGTEFKVRVNPDNSTSVVVIEGEVSVTGEEVTVVLTGGETTMVKFDQAPGPVVLAPPEELVEAPATIEPSPQISEPQATVEPGETAGPAEPDATATEPEPTTGQGTAEASVIPDTPTSTPEAVQPATPTATPKMPGPTATRRAPTRTATPRPPTPTATPKPPTATPEPPPPTATPSPGEVVEVFQATYNVSKEELRVKARTSLAECTLTLVGFGSMVREGGHWVYVERPLDPDDVPSTVTVRSSCGGSGTSPVQWE
jgi:hypothetical protein